MAYMDPMGLTSVMKIFHEGGVLGENQVSTHMEDEIIILQSKKKSNNVKLKVTTYTTWFPKFWIFKCVGGFIPHVQCT